MARLYSNENFPRQVVDGLRALGHDVLTSRDAGNAGQAIPDEAVVAFAAGQGRAVITLNRRDFIRLHRSLAMHAGILICTYDPDFAGQAQRVDAALRQVADLTGQLLRVNRSNV